MSKHETWRTREYHNREGGLLIEEFKAVKAGKDNGHRNLDGVIILGESKKISDKKFVDVEGKDIIVIQTKKARLGMYLMGQAFFSRQLMKRYKPNSIRTVAICGKGDEVMEKLADKFEIEVVVIPESERPSEE